MDKYDLIAFDMDGTLLTSNNTVSGSSRKAISQAVDTGKKVVICSGRAVSAVELYKESGLRDVRYYICENGALLYDSVEKVIMSATVIPEKVVSEIIDLVELSDCMVIVASNGHNQSTRKDVERMEHFYAERYKELQFKTGILHEDICSSYRAEKFPVEKLNIYCASVAIRDELFDRISQMPVTMVYAEETGLEVSPLHMTKGVGLRRICEILQVSLDKAIAVGDSDNDVEMMKIAGLSIAMGNACQCVKDICKVSVVDNDHGGCAEAIHKYLLEDVFSESYL